MILLRQYIDLEDTLIHLKLQVEDSLPYAEKVIPKVGNPEELYYWLRQKVTYLDDPKTRELLMELKTFATGSRTGVPWGGDCDDFTIASLSGLIVNGFDPVYAILVGRKKHTAVHIYAGVEEDGEIVPFDLTNDEYGYERLDYKYQQILPFNI